MNNKEDLIDKIIPLGKNDLNQFLDCLGTEKITKEEILNTFLLANIPEIITKEEFDDVKKAIFDLLKENKKYENTIIKLITNWKELEKYIDNNKFILNNPQIFQFYLIQKEIMKEVDYENIKK